MHASGRCIRVSAIYWFLFPLLFFSSPTKSHFFRSIHAKFPMILTSNFHCIEVSKWNSNYDHLIYQIGSFYWSSLEIQEIDNDFDSFITIFRSLQWNLQWSFMKQKYFVKAFLATTYFRSKQIEIIIVENVLILKPPPTSSVIFKHNTWR